MKLHLIILVLLASMKLCAQTDSVQQIQPAHTYTHGDSLYLSRLNTSGNLMIAAGVALCAGGSYLIYYGTQVYNNPVSVSSSGTVVAANIDQNHNEGTAYIIAGGAVIAGGIILGAFGVKNKIDFKQHLKYMRLQTGLLGDGALGASLTF